METQQPQNITRFWPLSPRLWRRSNDYTKVTFEPRKPAHERNKHDENLRNGVDIMNYPPDLLKSFTKERLEPLNLEAHRWSVSPERTDDNRCSVSSSIGNDRNRWSVDSKKPPLKESKKIEEVVRLRAKRQREPRPNSIQLLLCPSGSGHYISNTWRYTRVRSKR